jgi:hypothetical protein
MPTRTAIADADGEVTWETTYDVAEMAQLLDTSSRTVRRRVNGGYWPHVRGKGGRVLFTREHVRLIVASFNTTHIYPAHEPGRRGTNAG